MTDDDWKQLQDPKVVHINMLRGGIAKLTPEQIGHLYRGGEAAAVIKEIIRQNPGAFPMVLAEESKETIKRLEDSVDGLETDLRHAVRVAFDRGAIEWTKLNYRSLYDQFMSRRA